MTMIGTQLSRRYRLESKLGSGGMSTITAAVPGGHTVDNAANSYCVSANWVTPASASDIRLIRVYITYVINEPLP